MSAVQLTTHVKSIILFGRSYGRKSKFFRLDGGSPGVPVHGGISIVFISIHGVVTQFVNVSFLCVPVHENTTA